MRVSGRADSRREAKASLGVLTFLLLAVSIAGQEGERSGSPKSNPAKEHRRVAQTEVPGRRVLLGSLKGAQLFVNTDLDTAKPVQLIVHFHGAAWLTETHLSRELPNAALITVNLGAGSSVYGRPFEREGAFTELVNEAALELGLRKGWASITLSGFSAGYGAVRAILRHERNFELVDNVLLLDGIHADYVPEGRTLADGGAIDGADLDSFVRFAAEAVKGRKKFVITHSQIVPGTYASTTECTDYLLDKLKLKRKLAAGAGPGGMQRLSRADKKGFRVIGYAGDMAPDHVDHLHMMPEWFGSLGLRRRG